MSCHDMSAETLVALVDGELRDEEMRVAEEHVRACPACAREALLLRRAGDLIAGLPRLEPGPAFTRRVMASAGIERSQTAAAAPPRRGTLRRLLPVAAAAAAVLVTAVAVRTWRDGAGGGTTDWDAVLTASEEREIAADLYLLTNLDALRSADADELISLVDELDILEGTEPEVAGMFADDEGG